MFQNLKINIKFGIAVFGVSVLSLIVGYMVLEFYSHNVENQTYKNIQQELQNFATAKVIAKKQIGITNAISIANDGRIKKSLRTKDRKWAIISLENLSNKMKQNTKFKNVKVHIHSKDNKSFLRNWKTDKYGDDLSSFRNSVVQANNSSKAITSFEVGNAGLSLRSVVPVLDDDGIHLGSLEFMQGVNSVAKAFDKNKSAFLLLMNEQLKRKEIPQNKRFKNYGISQKHINKRFLNNAKKIDMKMLLKNGYLINGNYLFTFINIKDFQGKKLGLILLGKELSVVNKTIDSAKHLIKIALMIIAGLVILLMVLNNIILNELVIKPLRNIEDGLYGFFRFLNRTTNSTKKLDASSGDEFGSIAKVINENVEKIERGLAVDLGVYGEIMSFCEQMERGDFTARIHLRAENPRINHSVDSLNNFADILQTNMDSILKVLEEYSNYSYINSVKDDGLFKYFKRLADGTNMLGSSITNMLVENKSNGLTLDKSSNILLENVDLLNNNSNQAAASLEETAAALEEVTSNISSNTENIIKMSTFASKLTNSANEGQDLARQTTDAMNDIDKQVISISEAISVIDQIAFQTNILSLNAAVEAATAGESGKGFAVVAQEVRNLAARSADAANEIKSIVETARAKADDGKEIADKMIDGYMGLNNNISQTIDLISEVEVSSKEQLSGISQINDAVNELDKQTQQNARIASQTHGVAVETDDIAKLVVQRADEKEFTGKNSVQAKSKNTIKQVHDIVEHPAKEKNGEWANF